VLVYFRVSSSSQERFLITLKAAKRLPGRQCNPIARAWNSSEV
jgi:hypothetical protein